MKLPDFTKDSKLNALRQLMGAPLGEFTPAGNPRTLTRDEIERLTKEGIDVPLVDVETLPDGTLAYKNSRVILYIRDIAYYRAGEQPVLPRFHIADCSTLEDMRTHKRLERYVVATRDDGLFALNIMQANKWDGSPKHVTEKLPVCQNCLKKLQWDDFSPSLQKNTRLKIVDRFRISRFFEVYGKTLITREPTHTSENAPINKYSEDFTIIAKRIKNERNYICEDCGINLRNHQKFLHAHHQNGQKNDNRQENISILCIACHANQFNHAHIKNMPDYAEFIKTRPSIGTTVAKTPPNSSKPSSIGAPPKANPPPSRTVSSPTTTWVEAANTLARAHKLRIQDLRKEGGCVWVMVKTSNHPAAPALEKLGFKFSPKRQAFWRKN